MARRWRLNKNEERTFENLGNRPTATYREKLETLIQHCLTEGEVDNCRYD